MLGKAQQGVMMEMILKTRSTMICLLTAWRSPRAQGLGGVRFNRSPYATTRCGVVVYGKPKFCVKL